MTTFLGRPVVIAASPSGQPVVMVGFAPGTAYTIKFTSLTAFSVQDSNGNTILVVDTQTPAVTISAPTEIETTSPTAFEVETAGGTVIAVVDTTNQRMGVNITPLKPLHVVDQILLSPSAAVGANKRGVQVGGANNGTTQFSWDLSANNYVSQEFDITPSADGTTNPPTFPTPLVRLTAGGGLQVGTPTGGDKGAGTLNVAGQIYQNGAALEQPTVSGRATAQAGANANVLTRAVGAADGSFLVAANILITAFTAGTISMTIAYTDESNTARTLTLSFEAVTGALTTTPGAAGAFEGVVACIRAKSGTNIVAATTVSVFTGTYNVECNLVQVA